MEEKYFLTQIKRVNGTYEKGVVVKDSLDAARQSFHAYLGAYAYGNAANTDYVAVAIMAMDGRITDSVVWNNIPAPEPPVPPEPEED